MDGHTSININTKLVPFVQSPSMTLIPGWRNLSKLDEVEDCYETSDIMECVRNNSYNVIEHIEKEILNKTEISSSWEPQLSDPIKGIDLKRG